MKKSRLRKESKQPISKIQRDLWQECRRIAGKRYKPICYTCGTKGLEGSNKQLGHMLPKSTLGAYLKYDLRLLRWQCMRCNIHGGGMGAIFIENMRDIEGDEYVDQILRDRNVTVKAYDHYKKLLEEYKLIKR